MQLKTPEEELEYISGDTIQCLECGRSVINMYSHLKYAHGLNTKQYKEKHGFTYFGNALIPTQIFDTLGERRLYITKIINDLLEQNITFAKYCKLNNLRNTTIRYQARKCGLYPDLRNAMDNTRSKSSREMRSKC